MEIEEVFLGFSEVDDHSAVGLSTKIKQLLHNNNMDLLQCRGQGYDGARVMSGAYGGVQALIRQVQPNALINRWDLLSKFTGESTITLKKLNPTRWAGRYMSLLAIKLRYIDIMKALNEINLNTHKLDERNEKYCLNLIWYQNSFSQKNVDLLKATDNLKNAKTNLEKFRNGYESAKANALNIAKKDIIEYSQKIQLKYSNDLSAEFPQQLVMLVSMTTIKEELAMLNSIKEFLEFLIKQPLLNSSVPEVATALILFLTLPVTSANAERSFSKLKLIKNYLRSTQEQERLSDLAILAIEAKEAEKMDIKELIKTFSELKARKKKLLIDTL
ncbi:uncharacterized protein LOC112593852 [Melanaphis sacchari]|uniref:uncharacterized protein LOC112593852 n=1 Tax=Melanaphis sacchari TaxID=742174 RepID=UPI000DC13058|nr:uncharacterized protein LOC112593852 [Melanaphis sacchari]